MSDGPFTQFTAAIMTAQTPPQAARQEAAETERSDPLPTQSAPPKIQRRNDDMSRTFEAVAGAVQKHFSHLSIEDVMWPNYGWHDAAFARSVAIHLMVREFDVSRQQLLKELGRERLQLGENLKKISARLNAPCFAKKYEAMLAEAKAELLQGGDEL